MKQDRRAPDARVERATRRKGATASVATVADAPRAGDDNLACLVPRSQIDEIAAAEGIDVGATPEEEWAGRDGPRLWELRTAIKALAEQRSWSEYTRGMYLARAIKAATTGALVTRNPPLDGAPINGDYYAAIASAG